MYQVYDRITGRVTQSYKDCSVAERWADNLNEAASFDNRKVEYDVRLA